MKGRGRWGALLLVTLAVAAIVSTSAGARLTPSNHPAKIDLSSRAALVQFMKAHGINPKGIVIQRGAHNYAGPSCPGVGWTCTLSKRVLQVAKKAGDDSQFECTNSPTGSQQAPDTCTVIQISDGGVNAARCKERTSSTSASQRCVVLQANTTGDNVAQIEQRVDANGGSSQDVTQYAGVIQQAGGGGSNNVQVNQDINESTGDTTAAGGQSQEGHQGVSVTQTSDTGDNRAHVDQSLSEKASATSLTLNQTQNADGTRGPNTNAGINQDSNTGQNDAHLNQTNDLNGMAGKGSIGSQTQGSFPGGLNGVFNQTSDGLSLIHGEQHEHQNLNAPKTGVTQTQVGPMHWDPDQGDNPNDRYKLNQDSDQHAGDSATQTDNAFTQCFTSGTCDADIHISQNGQNFRNSCTGGGCDFGLTVNGGKGSTCGGAIGNDEGGGCDVSFPPPPPPPTRIIGDGCGIDCLDRGPGLTGPTGPNGAGG